MLENYSLWGGTYLYHMAYMYIILTVSLCFHWSVHLEPPVEEEAQRNRLHLSINCTSSRKSWQSYTDKKERYSLFSVFWRCDFTIAGSVQTQDCYHLKGSRETIIQAKLIWAHYRQGCKQGPVKGKFQQVTRPWNSDMRAAQWWQAIDVLSKFRQWHRNLPK